MIRFVLLPLLLIFGWAQAQDLDGAWKLTHQNGKEITDDLIAEEINISKPVKKKLKYLRLMNRILVQSHI